MCFQSMGQVIIIILWQNSSRKPPAPGALLSNTTDCIRGNISFFSPQSAYERNWCSYRTQKCLLASFHWATSAAWARPWRSWSSWMMARWCPWRWAGVSRCCWGAWSGWRSRSLSAWCPDWRPHALPARPLCDPPWWGTDMRVVTHLEKD